MRKLRELTTRYSLAELVEVVAAHIEDGETSPEAKPEGEREFVKLHKVAKTSDPDMLGNPKFSGKVKKDTSRAGKEPLPGFPPEIKEGRAAGAASSPFYGGGGAGGHSVADSGGTVANRLARAAAPAVRKPAAAAAPVAKPAATAATKPAAAPVTAPTPSPIRAPVPVAPPLKATPDTMGTTAPDPRENGAIPKGSAQSDSYSVEGPKAPAQVQYTDPNAGGLQSVTPKTPAQQPPNLARDITAPPAGMQTDTGVKLNPAPPPGDIPSSEGGGLAGAWNRATGGKLPPIPKKVQEEVDPLMEHRAAILGSLIRGLEPSLNEADAREKDKSRESARIARPKFDARGNLILTQSAAKNVGVYKPTTRKIKHGPSWKPADSKRFGESKELDEAHPYYSKKSRPPSMREPASPVGSRDSHKPGKYAKAGRKNWFKNVGASTPADKDREKVARQAAANRRSGKTAASARRRAEMSKKYPELSEGSAVGAMLAAKAKKETVLVSPKGYKGGGKVTRIPKSQYDPKKHSLAEAQLDEKNWIQGAIKKPGALTAAAHRAKKSVGEFAREHKHSSGKVGQRSRLALTLKGLNKEETERLDELKPETLISYTKGAARSMSKSGSALAAGFPIVGFAKKNLAKREKGIGQAADRLGGTYKTGKPRSVMIPGKNDNDPASGPYKIQKTKIYHKEETQVDEGAISRFIRRGLRTPSQQAAKGWSSESKRLQNLKGPASKEDEVDIERAGHNLRRYEKHIKGKVSAGIASYNPKEETQLDETITKSTSAGDVIHDFVHSKNKVFKGDDKKQRIKRALGAYYGKQRGE